MNVGAKRDYRLRVDLGTLRTGEEGLLISVRRDEERFLVFIGKYQVSELISMLRDAQFELEQRPAAHQKAEQP
jgi:hypothetical protein